MKMYDIGVKQRKITGKGQLTIVCFSQYNTYNKNERKRKING